MKYGGICALYLNRKTGYIINYPREISRFNDSTKLDNLWKREGRSRRRRRWRVFLGNGVWSGFYLAATRRWPHCSLMLANPAKSGTADESGTVSAMLWTPCEKCDLVREARFGNSAWPHSVTASRPSLPRIFPRRSSLILYNNEMFSFFFLFLSSFENILTWTLRTRAV